MKRVHLRLEVISSSIVLFFWTPLFSAIAQTATVEANAPIRFTPNSKGVQLSGRGRPRVGRAGGGTRGNCPLATAPTNSRMVPLVPGTQPALSATNSPSIWVYIPYSGTDSLKATVVLRDGDERSLPLIASSKVTLTATPGIHEISLPQSLEAERLYIWYVTLHCNNSNKSQDPFVAGEVRWIAPNPVFQTHLAKASKRDQVALYAQQGFWYDAVALLAADPTTKDWADLLKSGLSSLEAIAQEKVIP